MLFELVTTISLDIVCAHLWQGSSSGGELEMGVSGGLDSGRCGLEMGEGRAIYCTTSKQERHAS